ncbi:MAG: alkaline phosphatase family protein [Gemmatimonadaceae bacterium]
MSGTPAHSSLARLTAARHSLTPVGTLLVTLLAAACTAGGGGAGAAGRSPGGHPAGAVTNPSTGPTLVVVVTVDQMRADYLDRFAARYTGGFARLVRGGARFTNAQHDHAGTETAPGHATILSGRFPRSTGIVSNALGVADSSAPLVGGGQPGASPRRFRGTALYDWMAAGDRRARALSVSMKDRAAILPLGRARQRVFWYELDGRFTTSSYYADTLPGWVRAFDDRQLPRAAAGHSWTLLLPDSAYPEPDSVPQEAGGAGFLFPHTLPADGAATSALRATPWMDEVTLDLALAGVRAMRLGDGPATDLLSVSLSATDVIGHRYGPDSREIHDQMLRLDRYLGAFLDSLFAMRDSTRVVVALTADHGVASFPELSHAANGAPAARWVDLSPTLDHARAWLGAHGVPPTAIEFDAGALWEDRGALAAGHASEDSLAALFTGDARALPGVLRVDRPAALASADTEHDAIARRWLHSLPANAPVAAVVTLTPGSVFGTPGGIAMHGSPHDYDTHVPLILYGAPFRPGRYEEPVRVVDLAPTLAHVLGVTPLERVDGRVLTEALR